MRETLAKPEKVVNYLPQWKSAGRANRGNGFLNGFPDLDLTHCPPTFNACIQAIVRLLAKISCPVRPRFLPPHAEGVSNPFRLPGRFLTGRVLLVTPNNCVGTATAPAGVCL